MAWEIRGGRRYYYRQRRRNGRPVREYIGAGEAAELIAQIDQAERARQEQRRSEALAVREQILAAESIVAALDVLTERLFREAMQAAGFHQHARGQWRRRRVTETAAEA